MSRDFIAALAALAPWLSERELSDAFNEVDKAVFDEHPEYLELPEKERNAIAIRAFKKSRFVNRH